MSRMCSLHLTTCVCVAAVPASLRLPLQLILSGATLAGICADDNPLLQAARLYDRAGFGAARLAMSRKSPLRPCSALPQVDTMIVQAIGLLDDLDKELNTYAMRVREWYGWHFPEMTRVVTDNLQYAKTVGLCDRHGAKLLQPQCWRLSTAPLVIESEATLIVTSPICSALD